MSKPKTAIITGSHSGIGHPFAEALAGAGMNVVLNGIEPIGQIEPAHLAIETKYRVKAIYSAENMMEPDGVRNLIGVAEDAFGLVDVLVNNVSIQFVSPVEEFLDDKWEQIIALDFSAEFYANKAVVACMKQCGWGRIINIASAHGIVASSFKSAYVAAKARGITEEEVKRDVLLADRSTKKFFTVEEFGAFTVFLSTDAGASIIGTALPVVGSCTAH